MEKIPSQPKTGRPQVKSLLKKRYFRATDEQYELIERAANLSGRSRGEIIRDGAVDAAERIVLLVRKV